MIALLPRFIVLGVVGAVAVRADLESSARIMARAAAEFRVTQMRTAEAERSAQAARYRDYQSSLAESQLAHYRQQHQWAEEAAQARRQAEVDAIMRKVREEVAEVERQRREAERREEAERQRQRHENPGLGMAEANRAYAAGDYNTAIHFWKWWAERKIPEAQFQLGWWLAYRTNPADKSAAFSWFSQAAQAGHVLAMVETGVALAQGAGTGQDFALATDWLTRAVQHGELRAYSALARTLADTANPKHNVERATMLRVHAMTFGEAKLQEARLTRYDLFPGRYVDALPEALALLSEAHRNGEDGIARNPVQAYEWLALAAQLSPDDRFDARRDTAAALLERPALAEAQSRIARGFWTGEFRNLPLAPNRSYAIEWWKSAARLGHMGARLQLAEAYEAGWDNQPGDPASACAWFTVAAMEPGDPRGAAPKRDRLRLELVRAWAMDQKTTALGRADYLIGQLLESGLGLERPDYAMVVKHYQAAGNHDRGRGYHRLAVMHEQGIGVERSAREARKYYLRAAWEGSLEAQLALGSNDPDGIARSPDFVEALAWLLPLAEGDHALAQFHLAERYEKQGDRPEYLVAAYRWYLLSGSRGEGPAQVLDRCAALEKRLTPPQQAEALAQIGRMRLQWPFMRQEAVFWMELAAELGSPIGMHYMGNLSRIDESTQELAPTPERALAFYRKAAALGVDRSQLAIGEHYEEGTGVPADPVEACAWYWASGLYHGELDAQLTVPQRRAARERLARRLEEGREIPRNLVRAGAIWRLLAQEEGNTSPAAEQRNRIARPLSPADRAVVLHESGRMLLDGQAGALKNEAEGWEWIRKAAELGNADAMCDLGRRAVPFTVRHFQSDEPLLKTVTAAEVAEATHWLLAAAKRGNAEAFFQLALLECRMIRRNGEGREDALGLVEEATPGVTPPRPQRNDIDMNLPTARELGLTSAEADPEYADFRTDHIQLLRAAAGRGHGEAEAALGEFHDGKDWPQRLRSAAQKGCALAQCELAVYYDTAEHKDRDPLRSSLWLALGNATDPALTASYRQRILFGKTTNSQAEAILRELEVAGLAVLD
ncbi:MAG: uncharacterized protein QG602_3439 [Verrucomicrobiota bacterium]|nr:uncharacterized protein [Verrucomicrobiota bacterium]